MGDVGTSLCHPVQDIGTADHAAERCHVLIEFETGYEANNELTPGRQRARLHHAKRAREMSARSRHIGFAWNDVPGSARAIVRRVVVPGARIAPDHEVMLDGVKLCAVVEPRVYKANKVGDGPWRCVSEQLEDDF